MQNRPEKQSKGKGYYKYGRGWNHNGEWHIRRAQQFVYGLNGLKLRDIDSAYLNGLDG
jgi:stalled ribosome alternative rescue factor ArfA